MKTRLMAVGMMAAACAFGGVYDDCVYLFEGELPAGVNNIRLTVTGGGCDYFDYHRFQLVPPADGTYIVIK